MTLRPVDEIIPGARAARRLPAPLPPDRPLPEGETLGIEPESLLGQRWVLARLVRHARGAYVLPQHPVHFRRDGALDGWSGCRWEPYPGGAAVYASPGPSVTFMRSWSGCPVGWPLLPRDVQPALPGAAGGLDAFHGPDRQTRCHRVGVLG